ncbi:esterase/lipase family protein [Arcanobacterium pinnipediorum]|uniref:Alpha/beta hydrolase n=1 Tax=Arcanobacterium pinnipediorum TaxID=1503041 RepID=A0ABY5AG04_9ACTO|nr:hypothetical protein [Arcanobacterium pinnipediorum]USR79113.1 hypothetical protein NG665_06905 [Arcanobacterium pinnipediorum]
MGIKDRIKDYGWFVCTALNRTPLGIRNHPRATVVVIPGIYEGRTQLMPLARSLHEAGYQVEIIGELAMLTKPTAKLARIVAQRVATIPGPVVLLAHSKGGLVGASVLESHDKLLNLAGMVAIATPWQGSSLAQFFPPNSPVRRLAPDGLDLAIQQRQNCDLSRIYSLIPRSDPHVPNGSYLPGAHNIRLTSSGHFFPLGTAETKSLVHESLRRLLTSR